MDNSTAGLLLKIANLESRLCALEGRIDLSGESTSSSTAVIRFPFMGSLCNLRAEQAFVDWFTFKLYSVAIPKNKRAQNNKSILKILVGYLCLLTPVGTTITESPGGLSPDFQNWVKELRRVANTAIANAQSVIRAHHLRTVGKSKRNQKLCTSVTSMYRTLSGASIKDYPLELNMNCDQATPVDLMPLICIE